MTRRRVYILKNNKNPEEDLWVEMDNATSAVPIFSIYCEGEEGKQKLITLTTAMANRMMRILEDMLNYSNKLIEDYALEPEAENE